MDKPLHRIFTKTIGEDLSLFHLLKFYLYSIRAMHILFKFPGSLNRLESHSGTERVKPVEDKVCQ